jgi:uncharacterized membrane protein/outer membrane protein assembly factor BamB
MLANKTAKYNFILACVITSLLLLSLVIGAIYTGFISTNSMIKPEEIADDIDEESAPELDEPVVEQDNIRGKNGGELKWSILLTSDQSEAMLSTPAITDLNPPVGGGKKYYEVVVGVTDDHVYAVDKDGKLKWTYSDCVIDDAITATSHISLDFDPAPFFSSITPVDISGGKAPELLMGEQDGVLAIASDGATHWTDKGTTDGYYFSSIAVTDLEGDFAGIDADGNYIGYRDDLEIVLGSDDDSNADAYLEAWQANGQEVFRYNVELGFEHAFMTNSIVATELDGYFQGDEKRLEAVRDSNPDTLYADFLMSTHAYPGRIWSHQDGKAWDQYEESAQLDAGHWGGHETYATSAVGNFTGGPELEIIIGHGSGAMSWQSSDGTIRMYRQDGIEVADPFTTGSAPSSVFSSPAVADAQNVDEKDLADDEVIEYEVFFGCDNGIFYSLSATDLRELWSFQTGGRILSSPAIANINSDDRLEVIIGSDDGIVYCFEADPQEFDRDGEAHPKDDGIEDAGGDSGAYDILWTFDTKEVTGSSGEIGISSPVVGDIDYDGQLEVLIGDTMGTLYCISAGGTAVPGQLDWPMFHGDLNKTGFYNPGTSYGVDIEPQIIHNPPDPPHRESLKKSVKPGGEVTYNLTVSNIGTSKTYAEVDTFWFHTNAFVYKGGEVQENHEWPEVELTGEALQWTGNSEGIGEPYVKLASFKKTNITLTVAAPWSGDLSEFIQVEVEANSSMDPWARDSVQTTTSLEIFLDFEIDILKEPIQDTESDMFGQKVIKINPSDKASIDVGLMNLGNLNDTYDLRIDGVLFGWEAYFVKSESSIYKDALQLDAEIMEEQFPTKYRGSEGQTKFTIIAPADAQEHEILTLKVVATSKYSQETNLIDNISKFDYLIVEVNPVPDLELDCKNPRQYVTAGENITFEVEVINRGNSKINVLLEQSQLEEGWELNFATDIGTPFVGEPIVEVMNEGVTKVQVMLKAPKIAAAGSRQNVIIRGTTQTSGEIALQSTDTVALTAIVSQFFDINVSINPESQKVNPGETIIYDITIDNVGNGDDFLIITPSLLEVNWDSTFYLNEEERVTSDLNLNESVTFQMQIKIPKNQLAGTYSTGVNITSIGDREIMYFDTEVNQIFNFSIFGVVHSQETSDKELVSKIRPDPGVSPGSILNYVFEVTNGGNAPDEVKIDITSVGEEWDTWEGVFLGITNTEAYMTDVDNWDFAEKLDMSSQIAPVGYLNSNPDTSLHRIELKLGVGQKLWVKVQITVPRDISTTDTGRIRNFNIHGESLNPDGILFDKDLNDNDVKMELTLLFPDLVITSGVRHPSKISNGEIVTISAEVKNDGDIEAREVLVTFYVDGKEVKTQTINILPDGSSRLIPFTWQAVSGDHELKIKIDPEDAIVEKYENNNEKTKDVNVESGGIGELLVNRTACSIIPLIAIIVILAIIFIIIKKRGSFMGWKPGGGEEY